MSKAARMDRSQYALGFEHGWMMGAQVIDHPDYVAGWQRGRDDRDRVMGVDALAGVNSEKQERQINYNTPTAK